MRGQRRRRTPSPHLQPQAREGGSPCAHIFSRSLLAMSLPSRGCRVPQHLRRDDRNEQSGCLPGALRPCAGPAKLRAPRADAPPAVPRLLALLCLAVGVEVCLPCPAREQCLPLYRPEWRVRAGPSRSSQPAPATLAPRSAAWAADAQSWGCGCGQDRPLLGTPRPQLPLPGQRVSSSPRLRGTLVRRG